MTEEFIHGMVIMFVMSALNLLVRFKQISQEGIKTFIGRLQHKKIAQGF